KKGTTCARSRRWTTRPRRSWATCWAAAAGRDSRPRFATLRRSVRPNTFRGGDNDHERAAINNRCTGLAVAAPRLAVPGLAQLAAAGAGAAHGLDIRGSAGADSPRRAGADAVVRLGDGALELAHPGPLDGAHLRAGVRRDLRRHLRRRAVG